MDANNFCLLLERSRGTLVMALTIVIEAIVIRECSVLLRVSSKGFSFFERAFEADPAVPDVANAVFV